MQTDNNGDNGDATPPDVSEFRLRGGGLRGTESKLKTLRRVAGATLLVSGFSLFAGLIADSFRPTQAQDGTVQIQAAVGTGDVSITIDNSGPCANFDDVNTEGGCAIAGFNNNWVLSCPFMW